MSLEYCKDEERVLNCNVEHNPLFKGEMFDFFICFFVRQLFRCRSPP